VRRAELIGPVKTAVMYIGSNDQDAFLADEENRPVVERLYPSRPL
jgi:hypothetical protein